MIRRAGMAALAALTLAAPARGVDVTNTAAVRYRNAAGLSMAPVSGSATFTVLPGTPRLDVTVAASLAEAYVGEEIVFTLTVRNTGDGTAFNVSVFDSLPAFLDMVPGSAGPPADAGWDPAPVTPQKVRWSMSSIGIGVTATLTFRVRVLDPGGIEQVVLNGVAAHYEDAGRAVQVPGTSFAQVTIKPGPRPPSNIDLVVQIYDASGRLVRTLHQRRVAAVVGLAAVADGRDQIRLKSGEAVPVLLSDGTQLGWDTLDNDGRAVASGFYTVRVSNLRPDGRVDVFARTLAVTRADPVLILSADLVPNPTSDVAWVSYNLSSPNVRVEVKIYNLAGELLRKARLDGSTRSFRWDLRNRAGRRVNEGLYVIALDAHDPGTNDRDRRILKLVVTPE